MPVCIDWACFRISVLRGWRCYSMEHTELKYPLFTCPGSLGLVGQSFSGKSSCLARIFKYKEALFGPVVPKNIVYCYSFEPPEKLFEGVDNIIYHEGLPDLELINTWVEKYSTDGNCFILAFDDLSAELFSSPISEQLLTRITHHGNIFTILVMHSLHPKGKFARISTLNLHGIILLPTCRELQSIVTFGTGVFGKGKGNFFLHVFLDATQPQYFNGGRGGYLYISLHPRLTKRDEMLFTSIFPDETPLILYKI